MIDFRVRPLAYPPSPPAPGDWQTPEKFWHFWFRFFARFPIWNQFGKGFLGEYFVFRFTTSRLVINPKQRTRIFADFQLSTRLIRTLKLKAIYFIWASLQNGRLFPLVTFILYRNVIFAGHHNPHQDSWPANSSIQTNSRYFCLLVEIWPVYAETYQTWTIGHQNNLVPIYLIFLNKSENFKKSIIRCLIEKKAFLEKTA